MVVKDENDDIGDLTATNFHLTSWSICPILNINTINES